MYIGIDTWFILKGLILSFSNSTLIYYSEAAIAFFYSRYVVTEVAFGIALRQACVLASAHLPYPVGTPTEPYLLKQVLFNSNNLSLLLPTDDTIALLLQQSSPSRVWLPPR